MSYQPCDSEGEPLQGTELKEVWRVVNAPTKDKFQYTHFSHKVNSFETATSKLLASDPRLRPDRMALENSGLSTEAFWRNTIFAAPMSPLVENFTPSFDTDMTTVSPMELKSLQIRANSVVGILTIASYSASGIPICSLSMSISFISKFDILS